MERTEGAISMVVTLGKIEADEDDLVAAEAALPIGNNPPGARLER